MWRLETENGVYGLEDLELDWQWEEVRARFRLQTMIYRRLKALASLSDS